MKPEITVKSKPIGRDPILPPETALKIREMRDQGMWYDEIAENLGITKKSVTNYLERDTILRYLLITENNNK